MYVDTYVYSNTYIYMCVRIDIGSSLLSNNPFVVVYTLVIQLLVYCGLAILTWTEGRTRHVI
jgi:hypothetical protein